MTARRNDQGGSAQTPEQIPTAEEMEEIVSTFQRIINNFTPATI